MTAGQADDGFVEATMRIVALERLTALVVHAHIVERRSDRAKRITVRRIEGQSRAARAPA